MRWLILTVAAFLMLLLVCAWLVLSGRVSYFVWNRDATVTLTGTRVPGRVLNGRATAIVTTLQAGKEHSYQLLLAGDTDFTGNMGNVVDCRDWVAPRFPVLIETRDYPPCVTRENPESKGWTLTNKAT